MRGAGAVGSFLSSRIVRLLSPIPLVSQWVGGAGGAMDKRRRLDATIRDTAGSATAHERDASNGGGRRKPPKAFAEQHATSPEPGL